MEISRVELIDGECYVKINMLENEIKKNKLLQQALNEIREYAQDLRLYDNDSTDILKIIDEVGGNEE